MAEMSGTLLQTSSPERKSPDLQRSRSQMKFTNRREKKGQKTKVLRKPKRNDILKSSMERISRKWSIISNVGERWETKEYLSVDSDRKVFKILTKLNGWRVNMSYNSTDSKDICLSFTTKKKGAPSFSIYYMLHNQCPFQRDLKLHFKGISDIMCFIIKCPLQRVF